MKHDLHIVFYITCTMYMTSMNLNCSSDMIAGGYLSTQLGMPSKLNNNHHVIFECSCVLIWVGSVIYVLVQLRIYSESKINNACCQERTRKAFSPASILSILCCTKSTNKFNIRTYMLRVGRYIHTIKSLLAPAVSIRSIVDLI